jgi:hypothetical protein
MAKFIVEISSPDGPFVKEEISEIFEYFFQHRQMEGVAYRLNPIIVEDYK